MVSRACFSINIRIPSNRLWVKSEAAGNCDGFVTVVSNYWIVILTEYDDEQGVCVPYPDDDVNDATDQRLPAMSLLE